MSTSTRGARRGVAVCLATVALVALAGCVGGRGGGASANAGASSATTDGAAAGSATGSVSAREYRARVLPIGRQFSQCARRNLRPDFPDPIFNQNGGLDFPDSAKRDFEALVVNPSSPCRKIMRQLYAIAPPPPAQPPSAELFAVQQRYARCMREHGMPEYPDPKRDGSDPLAGTDLNFILNFGPVPQRAIDARNACTSIENELRQASRRG
jgi:hypothetical protein